MPMPSRTARCTAVALLTVRHGSTRTISCRLRRAEAPGRASGYWYRRCSCGQQILRLLRRAVLGQIGRGRAQQQAHVAQLARNQRAVLQRGDAQRDLEALGDQIDDAVGQKHVEIELGIARAERLQHLHQLDLAQRLGRGDLEPAAGLAGLGLDRILQRIEIGDQRAGAVVVGAADLGHLHAARGAVDQAHAEAVLELADVLGYQRLRAAEPFAGVGEALRVHHRDEGAHEIECIHGAANSVEAIANWQLTVGVRVIVNEWKLSRLGKLLERRIVPNPFGESERARRC